MARRLDPSRLGGEEVRIFFLIVRREFISRVRSRFFIVGTVVFMVLLGGYIVLQALVLNKQTTTVSVGFTSSAQPLVQPLSTAASAEGVKIDVSNFDDVAGGEDQVRSGKLLRVSFEADHVDEARSQVESMCRRLLANPVMEIATWEVLADDEPNEEARLA